MGVLLVACGFIAGVLIEKGQTSSGTSAGAAGGLASRFAALRRDAGGATGSSGAGGPAGGAGATTGSVAYVSGETLYLTTSEGNTVKVTTSAGTTVTKTVSAAVKGIHPGETVAVVGPAGANGAISAESIRVGAGGGGFGALFGRRGLGRRLKPRWSRCHRRRLERQPSPVRQRRLVAPCPAGERRRAERIRLDTTTKEVHAPHRHQQT